MRRHALVFTTFFLASLYLIASDCESENCEPAPKRRQQLSSNRSPGSQLSLSLSNLPSNQKWFINVLRNKPPRISNSCPSYLQCVQEDDSDSYSVDDDFASAKDDWPQLYSRAGRQCVDFASLKTNLRDFLVLQTDTENKERIRNLILNFLAINVKVIWMKPDEGQEIISLIKTSNLPKSDQQEIGNYLKKLGAFK